MSFADLVKPMQTLCQTNTESAQCLFATLLTALLDASRRGVEEDEVEAVTLALAKVVADASLSFPQLLSAAMATLLAQPGPAKIDPERLPQIASHCDLGALAALTLEKALQEQKDEQQPQVKRKKENPGEEKASMAWLHLSDVFKTLGDNHSVVGVFSMPDNNISTHPDTGRALALEASGNMKGAQEVYRTLLDQAREGERTMQEIDLWNRGFLQSFAKLGQWDKLAAEMVKEVGNDLEGVWVKEKQHLVAPLLESHMHLLLDQPDCDNNIFGLLDGALKTRDRRAIVVEQGATEVAAVLAYKKRYPEALLILSKALAQRRLECFQHGRRNMDLLGLQAGTELEEYLLEKTGSGQAAQVKCRTNPLPDDNLCAWDKILSLRSLYGAKSNAPSAFILAKSYSKLCNAALSQNNIFMVLRSLRNLKQTLGFGGMEAESELREMHDHLHTKAWVLRTSQAKDQPASERFSKLFRHFLKHQREAGTTSRVLVETKVCVFTQLLTIAEEEEELTCQAVEATMKQEQDRRELRHLVGVQDLKSGLGVQMMLTLQEQLNMGDHNTGEHHQAVANFAFKQWQKRNEKSSEMSVLVIRHQIQAIQAGNLNARQLFPRILSLLAHTSSDNNSEEFKAQQVKIAAWTVLPWINQLMAALHNEVMAPLVLPLVESLASAYPQAARHPFLSSLSTPVNPTARAAKLKLDPLLLASPLEESFEQGLSLLSSPHIAAKDLLSRLQGIKKEHADTWRDRVMKEYHNFKALYLTDSSKPGDLHTKFAKDFGDKLASYFSSLKGSGEIEQQLRDSIAKLKLPTMLKNYSLFLAGYQVNGKYFAQHSISHPRGAWVAN